MNAVAYSGAGRTNVQAMLDAVLAISSDLDLHTVLNTIVDSCCAVTGARYGFLGVLGETGDLVDHVVHGLTDDQVKLLVDTPHGLGLLNHLLRHPHPVRLGGPLPQMDSFLGMPLKVGDAVFGTLCLTEKAGGGEFTEEDEAMVEALARVAGVAVDNARAFSLSERRREWVEATAQVAESLHPPFQIEDTLQQIAVGARRVARASLAAVVHGGDGGYDVPAADGPRFACITSLLEGCQTDLVRAQQTGDPVVRAHEEGGTLVLLPLDGELAYPGVLLVLLDRGRGSLAASERELLVSYAAQSSLALDRAQARADDHELLLLADRDRIARDLHDLVIQRLFATGLQLQGARRVTDLDDVRARLGTAVAELDLTIRDIRTTIFELEHDHDGSFRHHLGAMLREYEPVLGFTPVLRTGGALDSLVDRALAEQVLAVLREALSNCARHAYASACLVEVVLDDDSLLLRVSDNGVGVPTEVQESGLRNLRRRAEQLGGVMVLGPSEPQGTVFEWRVPHTP